MSVMAGDDEGSGRCFDCGAMPDEAHTVECDDACERRFARAQRREEQIHDFLDYFEVRS